MSPTSSTSSRRSFLRQTAAATLASSALSPLALAADASQRPNIVWIVGEDMSADLGCYGDPLARTPNLGRLAAEGARFTHAFTHAPVCAPSRSGLITGMYPTTMGSHHMRSQLVQPPPTFTEFLQKAGYHTVWPGKTDFNFTPKKGWVDSTQDWLRDPSQLKQPFFAYVNHNGTHESQTRATPEQHEKSTKRLKHSDRQDPAKLKLPPFYPDDPRVRNDLKQYHETVTALDYRVGDILQKLDQNGLRDNTIVLFFGDHGRGMPRYKRWCYDTGTRVPLLIRWPGKIKPGTVRDDLVAFVDFAPTMLTLAGAEIPKHMQGQPFLSKDSSTPPAQPRKYVFAARDRMDETFDRIRSVRDKRFRYVRNFAPEVPYAAIINYNEENPTMQAWRETNREGKLTGPAKTFFAKTKPKEELYDCDVDPYEVNNLADAPQHQEKLKELRAALDQWITETRDLGEVPETELIKRGLVVDKTAEYEERRKLHPKNP